MAAARRCSINSCDRPHHGRGLCGFHYRKLILESRTCSVPGCDGARKARRLCGKHYEAWRKVNGPPCKKPGCTSGAIAHRLCIKHLRRWEKWKRTPCLADHEKVQPAGEAPSLRNAEVRDGPNPAPMADPKLDRPPRPCSCCGRKFTPTARRRRLCISCFTRGGDSPFDPEHHLEELAW